MKRVALCTLAGMMALFWGSACAYPAATDAAESAAESRSTATSTATPEVSVPQEPATATPTLSAQEDGPVSIMFLHHSCGANLIAQGGVREALTARGYDFYDHGYNGEGLVLADGAGAGENYDIPDDNTDPDGLAVLFAQPLHDPPDNAFSRLMQYDVLVFKSCYPVSIIGSDQQLAEYQRYYLSMRDRMDELPDKLFVVVTQPPEIPNDTTEAYATRARALANWLTSDEFLAGHPNVVTFDFFDRLADPTTNMLRPEYRTSETDAHPNELANRTIAPQFVEFVDQAIVSFKAR